MVKVCAGWSAFQAFTRHPALQRVAPMPAEMIPRFQLRKRSWGMAHPLPSTPQATTSDRLSRMRVYRLAIELVPDAWRDAERLRDDVVTEKISGQLYAAVGSIVSNLAEGYSRSSGRERAHIFEYALGSVRETIAW